MIVRTPKDFSVDHTPVVRSMFVEDVYDWPGKMLRLKEVHKHVTGKGVKIAILDTGTSIRHPDLKFKRVEDFTGEGAADFNGHGTHVHGMMGMQINGSGYVGVSPDAEIYSLKVLDKDGRGDVRWLISAMKAAIDLGVDWINGSLSLDKEVPAISKLIAQMEEIGIGCTFAAGNESAKKVSFPANLSHCIATGAHDASKIPATFSNIGKTLDVMAPGVHVKSAWTDSQYRSASGTSMASPVVTGLCALIIELERNYGA